LFFALLISLITNAFMGIEVIFQSETLHPHGIPFLKSRRAPKLTRPFSSTQFLFLLSSKWEFTLQRVWERLVFLNRGIYRTSNRSRARLTVVSALQLVLDHKKDHTDPRWSSGGVTPLAGMHTVLWYHTHGLRLFAGARFA
jgi:hypothetical protein